MKDEARQCLQQAFQAYEEAEGGLSITQAASLHTVSKTMLCHRINGRRDQVLYITSKQRLTPKEEEHRQNWMLQLQSWGFPPRIAKLCKIAEELLRAKQDFKKLGKNWSEKFLSCHLVLQSKYSRTFD